VRMALKVREASSNLMRHWTDNQWSSWSVSAEDRWNGFCVGYIVHTLIHTHVHLLSLERVSRRVSWHGVAWYY